MLEESAWADIGNSKGRWDQEEGSGAVDNLMVSE